MGFEEKRNLNELSIAELLELADETRDVEILRELSNHEKVIIRGEVALNPYTPEDIIQEYAQNGTYYIKKAVIKRYRGNRLLISEKSLDVLETLAQDDSDEISDWALAIISSYNKR